MPAKKKLIEFRDVPVNLRVPVDMPSRLAHHLNVQDQGDIVQLSFFEIVFPVLSSQTTKEELAAVEGAGLFATCVSKINIPKSRYADFVKAINSIE